jgi:cation diffusion facilitator family transporter
MADPAPTHVPPPSPYREGLVVAWLSLTINLGLAAVKIGVGFVATSQALIADGLHSLADLSSDIAVLAGLKFAAKPGDADHPYGHHKFASLACLFIAAFLLIFCGFLIWNSAHSLLDNTEEVPGWAALAVALVALVVKESFFHYATAQARRLKSRVLAASALDHRADALASLLVVIAIAATHLGGPSFAFLDKAVGLALGGYLFVLGSKILRQACADLLDTAPAVEIINDLREHILAVPGALAYHNFRARRVGDLFDVDLHLQVDPQLTVEQGHEIARQVKLAIHTQHPEVLEVLVHLEPAVPGHLKEVGVHDRQSHTAN